MARYILIETDSDDVADKLLSKLKGGDTWRVVGLFQRPVKFCDCDIGKPREEGFSRGIKFGWWVHSTCRRPTRPWSEGKTHWTETLGRNLLPDNDWPVPQGWPRGGYMDDEGRILPRAGREDLGYDVAENKARRRRERRARRQHK